MAALGDWAEVVPVSAVTGSTRSTLLADVLVVAACPRVPPLYPEGELTDEPERDMVAELIREAALEGVRDELPHSIAVVVEEMVPARGSAEDRHCSTCTPSSTSSGPARRPSSSAPGGERLRTSARRARQQIEALLGTRVYLDLHVKVAKDWQRDPKQLRRLGFYD